MLFVEVQGGLSSAWRAGMLVCFQSATLRAEGLRSIPLIINFAVHGNRWWRLAAIPGMWAGLTIFVSAMYGVCMRLSVACRSN